MLNTITEEFTTDELKERLQKLIKDKQQLEHTFNGVTEYLLANGGVNHEPLVDNEGFPRADLDIY